MNLNRISLIQLIMHLNKITVESRLSKLLRTWVNSTVVRGSVNGNFADMLSLTNLNILEKISNTIYRRNNRDLCLHNFVGWTAYFKKWTIYLVKRPSIIGLYFTYRAHAVLNFVCLDIWQGMVKWLNNYISFHSFCLLLRLYKVS